jgi:serine/threonine protein kinase
MPTVVQDPFALVGVTLEDRFAIERAVARGGYGVVYQGQHLTLGRTVALKALFIPRELDARARQHFLDGFAQEAQTIASLDHPAIVRVFDFGVARSPNDREMPSDGAGVDRRSHPVGSALRAPRATHDAR